MLTLTENASTIVRDINAQQPQPESGLRITSDAGDQPAFAVTTCDQPEPGDQVVQQDGATVYLDESASQQLDDKVLDASLDPNGNVQFALGLQP